MTDEQAIQQAAEAVLLGDAVQAFLESKVGRFVTDRIEDEVAEGIEHLKSADAEDPKAIRKAQNRIRMLEDLKVWLAEAIHTANEVERQMTAPPDE